jgi:hypothetical protein
METANVATQDAVDQRLDALDRALHGLMPWSERTKFVAEMDARIRAGRAAPPASDDLPATRRSPVRRSRLALLSGTLGIVALALLLLIPITYVLAEILGEAVGELFAYGLLGANILAVAMGGTAAVALGIAALVRLSRRHSTQVGHGWAITGLCTGPMPMLVGGLATLTVVLPMLIASTVELSPEVVYSSSPVTYTTVQTIPPSMEQDVRQFDSVPAAACAAAPTCAAPVCAAPACAASACYPTASCGPACQAAPRNPPSVAARFDTYEAPPPAAYAPGGLPAPSASPAAEDLPPPAASSAASPTNGPMFASPDLAIELRGTEQPAPQPVLVRVESSVPFLSQIPYLGRLFKNVGIRQVDPTEK